MPGPPARTRAWPAVVLELLTAAAVLYGGVGLAWQNRLGMPDSWLQHTPFTSWLVPGLLLLLVVAVPMGAAAVLELRRSARASAASVAAGAAQVGWIAGELFVVQKYNVLQPGMLCVGLVVLLLAVWRDRRRSLLPPERRPGHGSEGARVGTFDPDREAVGGT